MENRLISISSPADDEETITLDSYVGQQKIVDMIKIGIAAVKMRNEQLGHILLVGVRGSGKSTLAAAIAHELGVNLGVASACRIENIGDLPAILTAIKDGTVLLIENVDALQRDSIEILCAAMEDFSLDIIIGKGPKSIRLDLPKFTLVATMDEQVPLPEKLKNCFTYIAKMTDYTNDELIDLVYRCASKMGVEITADGASEIALFVKGDYRRLLNTLKRARDFALVKGDGVININIAKDTISCIEEIDLDF